MNIPTEIKVILDLFLKNGYQIYLVGGAVRDLRLGKPTNDWDFTTNAAPEQMTAMLPDSFYKNEFGTVSVPISEGVVEITTMRQEGAYSDTRHPDEVKWTDQIEEDLKRRDFTINAMAIQYVDGQLKSLVDPFDGQHDLEQKIIRAVGDPNLRFQEDALRLMRAIRFAAQLGFQVEEKTLKSVQENAKLLGNISIERIHDEFFKILGTEHYYDGVMMLRSCGLLEEFLPEIEKCFGVVQEGPRHDRVYDIGEHSMLALKFCPSTDPLVRFACFIHDIGKPDTYRVATDGNVTFYHHEVVGAKIAEQICHRLKLSNKQIEKVITLVRWHLFTVDENQTDAAIRRFIKHVGSENIDDMMALREADRLGGGTQNPTSWRLEKYKDRIKELSKDVFSIKDLAINGQDIMKTLDIPPSRKIGEILEKLFAEVEEDRSRNTKEYLLERVSQL